MGATGAPLKTATTPAGILDAEFAYNTDKATTVYQAWNNANVLNSAYVNTYWDFVFLICYSGLMYLLCLFVYRKLPISKWQSVAPRLGKLALVAALLDIVENGFMLTIFNNSFSNFGLAIMFGASCIKWIIVLMVIIYLIMSLLMLPFARSKNHS